MRQAAVVLQSGASGTAVEGRDFRLRNFTEGGTYRPLSRLAHAESLGVRQRRYPDLEQRARSKFDRPIHLLALTRHSLDLPQEYPLRVALLRNADARGAGRGLPANVRPSRHFP